MWQKQPHKSSFRESIKVLEADIQHANKLVAALPRDSSGDCVRMELSYSAFAPFVLFLIEWMDYTCLDGIISCLGLLHIRVYTDQEYVNGMPMTSMRARNATLKDFYAVIYPSLKQLEGNLTLLMEDDLMRTRPSDVLSRGGEGDEENQDACNQQEIEDECGICMEIESKVVLPECGHSMCIGCFHDWCVRSQSCPFCRSSLSEMSSQDLWVLTGNREVIDAVTLVNQNIRYFYCYIENLPPVVPDKNLLMHNYMM